MIVLIDNYDSFVHNLARYFVRHGEATRVIRNDATTISDLERLEPKAVVISPGPCTPDEAGISVEAVRHFAPRCPVLGVCLGHQAIAKAWGGTVCRARRPLHGQASMVHHDGDGPLQGIPSPFSAGRYHSLIVSPDDLPSCLEVTAATEDETIMAIRHRRYLTVGLQFHPESVLTEYGDQIIVNFLRWAGIMSAAPEKQACL